MHLLRHDVLPAFRQRRLQNAGPETDGRKLCVMFLCWSIELNVFAIDITAN